MKHKVTKETERTKMEKIRNKVKEKRGWKIKRVRKEMERKHDVRTRKE